MTMNVLQIQLRSLTAMDAVAYGGAAAGIGVAIWRFVSGSLSPSGVFRTVRRAAAWFDADRRGIADDSASRRFLHSAATARLVFPRCGERHDVHETYFRAARHARTGAWQQGTAGIRGFRAWCRRGVSWCFVPGMRTRMWDAGGAAGAGPALPGLRVPVLRVPVVYRPHRIPICGTRMWTALMRAAARVTRAKRATPCATWPSVRCPAKSLRSSGHPVPASPQPSSCLPARLSDMKAMCCCPKCHPECRTKCWALC